jgi:hypothetical protein
LWEAHNEHRIVLPKLILLAFYELSGFEFLAAKFFNVVLLGALTFGMIQAAKTLRGWMSYSDALFPLTLLHWGHFENLLLGFQVQFVSSTVLAGCLLVIIALARDRLTPGAALLAGLCLLMLPLCGMNGLALVPALALWFGYSGVLCWRSPGPNGKRQGLLLLAFAVAALLLVGLSFIDWNGPAHESPKWWRLTDLWSVLIRTTEVLGVSYGLEYFWCRFREFATLVLLLLSVAMLVLVWCAQPRERFRASGLLLFLGAMGCLALTIGWGRPTQGVAPRYVTLMAPVLCGVYLAWGIYGASSVGRLLQMCLFIFACLVFLPNLRAGFSGATAMSEPLEPSWRDLLAGEPLPMIVGRYGSVLTDEESLDQSLQALKQAGVWPYCLMTDLACREILLPVEPVAMSQMTWKDGVGRALANDASLDFPVQPQLLGHEPRMVHAIRLKFAYEETASPAFLQVFWGRSDQANFGGEGRSFSRELEARAEQQVKTVWVYDAIDRFRIHPDNKPCLFKLLEIVLLVPATDPAPMAGAEREASSMATGVAGGFDVVEGDRLLGWAWDPREPERAVRVGIYDMMPRPAPEWEAQPFVWGLSRQCGSPAK